MHPGLSSPGPRSPLCLGSVMSVTLPACAGGLRAALSTSCSSSLRHQWNDPSDPSLAPPWKPSRAYSFWVTCFQSWTSGYCMKRWSPLSRTAREPGGFRPVTSPELCLNVNSIVASPMVYQVGVLQMTNVLTLCWPGGPESGRAPEGPLVTGCLSQHVRSNGPRGERIHCSFPCSPPSS